MTPNDPLYSLQWHFALLGDIETIWEEYSGAGVTVGVFDDGVEDDHEDLDGNYDASLEGFYDSEPNSIYDGHGTSVAGIIGAEMNGIGAVGVAWGATLTGLDLLGEWPSIPLSYTENFDVANHSWGYGSDFFDWQDIGDSFSSLWYEKREFDDAAEDGRGGLGTINVKAAGNDYTNGQGEGLNNTHTIITVGAFDQFGNVMDYSNHGHNLLISAGAAAYTTDLSGFGGYNGYFSDNDYTNSFGGTSAATPVVSGVVALMLEANEGLGWRDVQNILATSAAQTGSAYGSSARVYENYTWDATASGSWNGGGMTYHASYGYGAVDAFAAVRMAEVWHVMHGAAKVTDNEQSRTWYSDFSSLTLNDWQTVSKTITVTEDMSIEHIYLTVDWYHGANEQVRITLIAPDGTESIVYDGEDSGYYFDDWTFGLANFLDQSALGDWTVEISDLGSSNSGTFYDFNIEFIGSTPTTDTVWDFTDDFQTLANTAGESGRRTINDTDGGSDWLNFAAITGDIVASLTANAAITVGGAQWATIGSGVIENFMGGDGNDDVTGGAEANTIWGQRGDDILKGEAGRDVLNGGQGDDVLYGGTFQVGHAYGAAAQVFRLFQATLDRLPGFAGMEDWTARLVTGEQTLLEVISGFVNSGEFQSKFGGTTNAGFVDLMYLNVLGRDRGNTGESWVEALNDGSLTREEVVLGFSESAEFELKTRVAAEDFIASATDAMWVGEIYRLFQATLGREPNLAGVETWMDQLGAGRDYLSVVTGFINSVEFDSVYGSLNNEDFVTLMFQNVLGRAPGAGGLAFWTGELDSGRMSREEVVRGFAEGAEFVSNTLADLVDFVRTNMIDYADALEGGAGDNTMMGGAGADTFIFDADADGTNVVHDLEAWDYLDFQSFGYTDHTEALANMVQDGQDVVFTDQGVTVTFKNFALADITAEMFTGDLLPIV